MQTRVNEAIFIVIFLCFRHWLIKVYGEFEVLSGGGMCVIATDVYGDIMENMYVGRSLPMHHWVWVYVCVLLWSMQCLLQRMVPSVAWLFLT